MTANSLYSSNIESLTEFPSLRKNGPEPSVPPGWKYIGTSCTTGFKESTNRAINKLNGRDGQIRFPTYECSIYVSRNNTGWWITSFFLHVGIIAIAFAGTMGVMSNEVAEARDDRDAARRALFGGTRLVGK